MSNRKSIPVDVEREILIESGHRCAVCGTSTPIERAHIIPWHKTKQHKKDNLICLCANCHERADKEHWDERTLRKYKQHPWVMRQYEKAESTQVPAQVVITSQMELEHYDTRMQAWLQHAVAEFLKISPDDVQVALKDRETVICA